MYNIFISYRREGGYELARLVYEHLLLEGYNPFFDIEELRNGDFNVKLYDTIEECDDFVLILNKNALDRCENEKDWLRLEISHAIEHDKNIIPFMVNGFEWPKVPIPGFEKLSKYNGVVFSKDYFQATIDKLKSMLRSKTKKLINNTKQKGHRLSNQYFSLDDKKEVKRLKIQQKLLETFDRPIYDKVLLNMNNIKVLDVGSNNGDFIMDRIGNVYDVEKIVGLEYDNKAVEYANKKYGIDNKIVFYNLNVEDEDLGEQLETIMENISIESFDVINISMVILHLKNPYKLLRELKTKLKPGGFIIIKDIDDGLNLAYPDENREFERVVNICGKNETAGHRKSGREIYTYLKRCGYKDIVLEKSGLSTIGMDNDERSALFHTYFSFILEDLKIMRERYPNNQDIYNDLKWYESIYDDLEIKFQEESFYFNLGFVLFTAKK